MDGKQIRALIKSKGGNVSLIAETLNVSHTTVCRVIDANAKSRRVANTIAIFLGKSVHDLWPGAYPEKYRRRGFTATAKHFIEQAAAKAAA